MSYHKVVALDMEMCCWDDNRGPGNIIQIGLVEFDLIKQSTTRTANYYITPVEDEISEYCTNLTGITKAKISKSGQTLESALQSISDKFGSTHTTYCGWGEDGLFLQKQCNKYGMVNPIRHYLNLCSLYMLKKRVQSTRRIGLTSALTTIDSIFEGSQHDALNDAKNLVPLIKFLL